MTEPEAVGLACTCGAIMIGDELLKPHAEGCGLTKPGHYLPLVVGGPSWGEMSRGIDRAIAMLDAAVEPMQAEFLPADYGRAR